MARRVTTAMASGSTELREFFEKLHRQDDGNLVRASVLPAELTVRQSCVDCGKGIDMSMEGGWGMWASVSNGCYFCMQCAGQHRSVGVHLR